MFEIEKQLWDENKLVIGADEVGRGAFAGPVVVASVIFAPHTSISKNIIIRDSKKMTQLQRNKANEWIKENALNFAISQSSNNIINKKGIVSATNMAFEDSLSTLEIKREHHILIDGRPIDIAYKHTAIIKGEDQSVSIAAASIIAKVYRDNLMVEFSKQQKYARYNFAKNKGYGTKEHREALQKHNLCDLHREVFVRNFIC